MKIYKVSVDDFFRCGQEEFIYKDLAKAKDFTISKLKETMNKVLENNENSKEFEDRVYVFETYSNEEVGKFIVATKDYYKSVKKVDDYILEIEDGFTDKTKYRYQLKYSIVTEDETYTDYNYSIEIEEFNLIE